MSFTRPLSLPSRRLAIVLGVAAALLLLAVVGADPALAADRFNDESGGAKEAGKNVGDLITGLARPIVFSLAGLTTLAAFIKRDVGLVFTAIVITLMAGLFVVPEGQEALQRLTKVLAQAIGMS